MHVEPPRRFRDVAVAQFIDPLNVLKYHPDFEMSFHAKMNSLINKSLQGESEESLISSLEKLAKDSKNEEYESEIFAAIGKIYYNAKKYTDAIDYLNRAIWSPTSKPNIKSDAYYLLANIYFDQAQFQTSKYYFDSTLTFLSKSDKRRPIVSKMVFNLKDIAEQLEIINLQDSLIRISGLSNKEKRALALDIKNRKRAIVVPNDMAIPEMNNDKVLRSPMLNRNNAVLRDMRGDKINEKAIGGVKSTFFAYDIKAAKVLSNPITAISVHTSDTTYLKPVIESLPSDMTLTQRSGAATLIEAYKDVFFKDEYNLGRPSLIEHHIETGDARPFDKH